MNPTLSTNGASANYFKDAPGYVPGSNSTDKINPTLPIDANAVAKSSGPLTIPSTIPTTPYAGMAASGEAMQASAEKQAEASVKQAQDSSGLTATQGKQSDMMGSIKKLLGLESDAQSASAAANQPKLDQATSDLNGINTLIADTNVKLRGELDQISGRGDISRDAQEGLKNVANANYGRQLADLAIRQSAANGNITALQNNAKYALEQKLAPLNTELSYYKDFLSQNLENLSKSEQAQVQNIIAEKNNILTRTQTQETAKTTLLTDTLKAGIKIPDDVMQKFLLAPDATAGAAILSAAGINIAPYQKITDAFGNESLAQPDGGNSTGGSGNAGTQTLTGEVHSGATDGASGTPGAGDVGTGTNKLSFAQYGLLANTDFNPQNQQDQLAQKYLDTYLKTGTVPTATTLGRAIKPGAMAAIDQRARDLYFKATGTALPNPEIIKANQQILAKNLQQANNLKIQEQTVSANVDFSIENMKKNDLNSAGFKPLDNVINSIQDMFNDPATGQLIAQNSTIQNELGSLLAVKNAYGTTVYDKLASANIIGRNDTKEQVAAKVNALIREATNFADSIQSANAGLYKQIDPLMQDANNPLRQSHINGQTVDRALSFQNIKYQDVIDRTPPGQIPVIDKKGQVFYVAPSEFSVDKYTKL